MAGYRAITGFSTLIKQEITMRTPNMQKLLRRFVRDESGSNALEYGLIVGLVSLAVVAGAGAAGTALGGMFNALGNKITNITNSITT
jgi:pilus assembly protein Flp/PilA